METMSTIIVNIAAGQFGIKEAKSPVSAYVPNHRKIQQLREELKALKRQYKKAGVVEKGCLSELHAILRKELLRVENHMRWHKERARRRAEFYSILAERLTTTSTLLCRKQAYQV